MFLAGVPSQRSVPSDDFTVFSFDDSNRRAHIIAFFMELQSGKSILTGPVKQTHVLHVLLGEERPNIIVFLSNLTVESANIVT
jgi:hypothetical protein